MTLAWKSGIVWMPGLAAAMAVVGQVGEGLGVEPVFPSAMPPLTPMELLGEPPDQKHINRDWACGRIGPR